MCHLSQSIENTFAQMKLQVSNIL